MKMALNPNIDREEAIFGIPEDKKIKNFRNGVIKDFSKSEFEYEHEVFPVNKIYDFSDWRREYNKYWEHDSEKSKFYDEFEDRILQSFGNYDVPIIFLKKQTPKEAVCQVFEKVNTGGVSLTVFELLTASFAADGYNLREDWEGKRDLSGNIIVEGRRDKLRKHKVLEGLAPTDFLQSLTLLTTYKRKKNNPETPVSCRKNDVLKLTLDEYKMLADEITESFIKASKFLFQQKIFSFKDIPYASQLVPLSAILAVLGNSADNDTVRDKLKSWFWCGIFGELYGGANETRFAQDLQDFIKWVEGGEEPKTVVDCNFAANRLYTLKTRNSAAYKGLYALLIRDGGLDFKSGEPIDSQTYFDERIDIHHIFPRDYCNKMGIDSKYYDSIINKTAISDKTNRIIGGKAPSEYLKKLRESFDMSEQRQSEILKSHVIEYNFLAYDDFEKFFEARKEELLLRIEKATGKKISRETQEEIEKKLSEETYLDFNVEG